MALTRPGQGVCDRRAPRGFTLIELLVVIAIIMLLAALALPVLNQAARQARATNCIGNLRQLAVSFRSYTNNADGILPGTEGGCQPYPRPTWLYPEHPWEKGDLASMWPEMPTKGTLFPYYREPELIHCPGDNDGNGKLSYSVPQCVAHHVMDNVVNSRDAILIMEEHPKYNIGGHADPARREGGYGCSDRPAGRHSGRTAIAFFDARAELTRFPDGFTANELWVDPWGHSCGWRRDDWDTGEYPHGRVPVGRTW